MHYKYTSFRGLIQFKLWKYDIRWTSATVGFTKKKKPTKVVLDFFVILLLDKKIVNVVCRQSRMP